MVADVCGFVVLEICGAVLWRCVVVVWRFIFGRVDRGSRDRDVLCSLS
jgi:hypothetical protein